MTRVGHQSVAIVQFPGSNCDVDCFDALQRHFGVSATYVWHTERELPAGVLGVVIPGGFSFGDYLRSGALASHSPIMDGVRRFVAGGGPVLGICNGFQVLTEAQLLPGALLRNQSSKFICKWVALRPSSGPTPFHLAGQTKPLRMPVAHGEGRYWIDGEGLARLRGEHQIVLRYENNPNGSVDDIAGVVNDNGRVFGLMPHPERAVDELLGGSTDGMSVWRAFLEVAG